ncbi:hypothetical protein VTN49DRAFT_7879 [Thermomyces lanuginosus]|uniref:uncharacterized protein n=1 Tax=Thermomyces lanuginosus TaxID=5541 RepID=UPI003742C9E5
MTKSRPSSLHEQIIITLIKPINQPGLKQVPVISPQTPSNAGQPMPNANLPACRIQTHQRRTITRMNMQRKRIKSLKKKKQ